MWIKYIQCANLDIWGLVPSHFQQTGTPWDPKYGHNIQKCSYLINRSSEAVRQHRSDIGNHILRFY